MAKKIRYRTNVPKAVETIVWLANKKPGIDIYHVAKVLYYADKMHLNRYGRPILGDTYINMEFGQVPSAVRDLITESVPWINPDDLEEASKSLKAEGRRRELTALRQPKMDYFSQTDIECLLESLEKYGDLSFGDLVRLAHGEKSYIETEMNQPIDYALMVDDDNPDRDEILREISETAPYVQV